IEDNTKVTIPANKRNYRKQEAHLYLARRKKEDMKVIGEVVKEGRPTAERTVREWQESHPTGKKADCIRETGLAKHTVYKWWKDINNENI
ncbi:replication protein, partial [Bacteroides xylanisolvens]